MTRFETHTLATAPAASKPLLEETLQEWGFIPNLHGILAESPIALKAYVALYSVVTSSATLSAAEQQVAFQAVNVLHGCEYCTAGHTFLSRNVGVPEEVIAAQREMRPITDNPRMEALRCFTEALVRDRGNLRGDAVDAFITAGFTNAQVLEVVTIVACKILSNYTNHLADTVPEAFMADPALKWTAPVTSAMAPS